MDSEINKMRQQKITTVMLGGYRVGITEDQLNNAPRFNRSTDWDWSDRARDRTVYDYYKTPLWY